MTDDEIREALGFDSIPDDVRRRYVPIGPFCITREQRRGVVGFRTTDMRTNRSVRVPTKRDATRVAKMIERDYYGPKKNS